MQNKIIKALYYFLWFKLFVFALIIITEGISDETREIYRNIVMHPFSLLVYLHTAYQCAYFLMHPELEGLENKEGG